MSAATIIPGPASAGTAGTTSICHSFFSWTTTARSAAAASAAARCRAATASGASALTCAASVGTTLSQCYVQTLLQLFRTSMQSALCASCKQM